MSKPTPVSNSMTRHNIPLGRILGIPIGLDYSWFVIFALLTWMLVHSRNWQRNRYNSGYTEAYDKSVGYDATFVWAVEGTNA